MNTFLVVISILLLALSIILLRFLYTYRKLIEGQSHKIDELQTELNRVKERSTLYIIPDGRNPKFGDF